MAYSCDQFKYLLEGLWTILEENVKYQQIEFNEDWVKEWQQKEWQGNISNKK